MSDMRDSIRILLEATCPARSRDPEVRSAAWRRLSLLPAETRGPMDDIIREVLGHEIHPLPLAAIRDYLTLSGTDGQERETARNVLWHRLRRGPLPPPVQKTLLDTLLPVSRMLSEATHRETMLGLAHTPFIIHPSLCVEVGRELLSLAETHLEPKPGPTESRGGDVALAVALKDIAGKLGERHPFYACFQAQVIHLCRLSQPPPEGPPRPIRSHMAFPLELERYLLSRRPHFRGHLLQALAMESLDGIPAGQQAGDTVNSRARLAPETFLDELGRELRGMRHEPVRAAGYELLAEADQYCHPPRFPAILTELIRSGPQAWKGLRLELEEYITQTPWYDGEGWERTGKVLWKFMHQNGETEIYTPLVQALATRLTPSQLARVVVSYPAAKPMPEPMIRSLRHHLASSPVTRAGLIGGGIGVDWKVPPRGQTAHPIPPSPEWTYEQWKNHFTGGRLPEPAEIDWFVESCRYNHRQVTGFFLERLSVGAEPLSGQRAWNWRVAGALIRRWRPESIGELARLAIHGSGEEPDPLVLATRLAQGRACRHALETLSPEAGRQWAGLYAGELIGQWYQSAPPTPENRELRWVKFHEMHLLRKALQETEIPGATGWAQRLQTVMEETFYGPDRQESRLAADCFRQYGETPRRPQEVRHLTLLTEQKFQTPAGRMQSETEHHMEDGQMSPALENLPGNRPSGWKGEPGGTGGGVDKPVSGPPSGPWRRPTFFR